MAIFVKTKEFTLLEFYVLQKCFEVASNIMKAKSIEDCTLIGNDLADLKFAEITIHTIREKQLLNIDAPDFICMILRTLKWFTNISRTFSKTLAQQEVVDLLVQRLRHLPDSTNKEWTSFANISAGIILLVLQNEKCIKDYDIKELAPLMSKFVSRKDQEAITDIKLLHLYIDNSKRSWFPEKVAAQMCVQGIIHAIENKRRSYKGFNLVAWIKCLTKMCQAAKIIYEILAAEPLDCLYDGISSPIVTEQEAAADCLFAIAEKSPGNFKIGEHTKIMSFLETMQCCGNEILEKKAISVLWYVKQEAIILSKKEEILAPILPEQWDKSTYLGNGTYGCVYLLQDLNEPTAEEFALKEMELMKGKSFENQMNSELNILFKVSHHRLVRFFGFQKKLSKLCMFFAYMPMGSLRAFAKKQNGLSEKTIKTFTLQILEGLNFLHSRISPIIHRDIKGENVLLENENSVKLADFGLAKIVTNSNLPKTNETCTTKWVAPEVLKGSENTPYDCKADIWSLACTVVEMATTNPPWPDHLPEQHMFQLVMGNKPQYLLSDAYSQALHAFLNKMFQYDPEKRPSSLELLNDPYVKWTCQSASN
ncbi:uncharacterized protein LOC131928129 [Physella acuta]|uniref:uncharacterized protein LOC131928129 n=1 Tax=Physella acuta TaxID=109671 RepID=UPI0027DDDE1B|nr:uncharacterized protein LOC131928129 [Physella acuta]